MPVALRSAKRAHYGPAEHSANSTRPGMVKPQAASIHSGPSASLSHSFRPYILGRRRPDEASRACSLQSCQVSSSTSRNPGTRSVGLIQHSRGTCHYQAQPASALEFITHGIPAATKTTVRLVKLLIYIYIYI